MALKTTSQPQRLYVSFVLLGLMILSNVKTTRTMLKDVRSRLSIDPASAQMTAMTSSGRGNDGDDDDSRNNKSIASDDTTTTTNGDGDTHTNAATTTAETPTMTSSSSSLFKSPVAQQLFNTSKTIAASNNNSWKATLFSRLTEIAELCGELCNINSVQDYERYIVKNSQGLTNPWFATLKIPLPHCPSILKSHLLDVPDDTIPFPVPKELDTYYGWNSEIKINNAMNVSQVYAGGEALTSHWSMAWVQNWTQLAAAGALTGNYNLEHTQRIRAAMEEHGKIVPNVTTVLVIGSETPWVEAICLSLGVKHVTTLEYGSIVSHHPQISTMTPQELGEKVLMNTTTSSATGDHEEQVVLQFDLIVTYSSVEHSGLGRYGDALNPWGDLLAVSRASCLLKPEGRMLLGVPTGRDRVEFNRHRIYGIMRYPILTNQFQVVNELQLQQWGFGSRIRKPRKSHYQYPLMLERLR